MTKFDGEILKTEFPLYKYKALEVCLKSNFLKFDCQWQTFHKDDNTKIKFM
jgi:hypothetical protein